MKTLKPISKKIVVNGAPRTVQLSWSVWETGGVDSYRQVRRNGGLVSELTRVSCCEMVIDGARYMGQRIFKDAGYGYSEQFLFAGGKFGSLKKAAEHVLETAITKTITKSEL
jgi:hypothetical protein